MAYFATEYTIHFDDTMAYGSHHFLTAFKLQCAARESFLFGDRVFDVAGVREALQNVHLFTSDAYARNLNPARVGDRIAILLTLEDWGRASARFCFRALDEAGRPICAGFQTIVCAKPSTGEPTQLPQPLWDAMEALRSIEEPSPGGSFRERLLSGGRQIDELFTEAVRATAVAFLASRYPHPQVVFPVAAETIGLPSDESLQISCPSRVEAWVFSGQGSLDMQLLSQRMSAYRDQWPTAEQEFANSRELLLQAWGPDAVGLLDDGPRPIAAAISRLPALSQPAIFLQNLLGAWLRHAGGDRARVLLGHSFGEIAALGAAGCFDLLTGLQIVIARVQAMERYGPNDGGLLAVGCSKEKAEAECAFLQLADVVVAGRNYDQQTIVSGPNGQLEALRLHLVANQLTATPVPSPSLFHHPMLRSASQAWYQRIRGLPIHAPQTIVYSPIGRRLVRPGDDIAATLSSQLVKPFDLQGAIYDLRDAGITHLIDCGSSGTLTRLLQQVAPEGMQVENAGTPPAPSVPSVPATRSTPSVQTKRRPFLADAPSSQTRKAQKPPPAPDVHHRPHLTVSQHLSETRSGSAVRPAVVISGQGCILPAGVTSPAELFNALQEQRNGLVDLRHDDAHWSDDFFSSKLMPDRSTSHLSGRVRDEDLAAPSNVSADWFSQLTRTQKLFCIALAPCLNGLKGAHRIRCYVGATADGFEDQDEVASLRYAGIDPTDARIDHHMDSARSAFSEPHDALREVLDHLATEVSVELSLVDAACASSLYALALGLWALERGETDAVLAGGVFCPGPGNSCLFSQFKGTTSTGCRPFDARADGVVFSEGAAMVVLRSESAARRLQLPMAAVVRGVGLSSDGRSTSANVPQTRGQLLSLERCYAAYQFDRSAVIAIEGHGTSTPVGDSTELETLGQFFASHVKQPIPLHSLKGLLGHAGWAAGTASIIAACEYLRRRQFPAQAHFVEPAEALRKHNNCLQVPRKSLHLPDHGGSIAIDGFGFGGANAHVVLEDVSTATNGPFNEHEHEHEHETHASNRDDQDELVIVGWHTLRPPLLTTTGQRFDRDDLPLGSHHLLLPDLADDMDISQRLAIQLADGLLSSLPDFDADDRRGTSFVLALSGKTERGVEATMRVLANRLKRRLREVPEAVEKLDRAVARARPSGPYTLQCMMPNVASGRAALQGNWNGPNYVIDAAERSLEAALESADLLLRAPAKSGTTLVLVAGMEVNGWRAANFAAPGRYDEAAGVVAVTWRSHASSRGLPIVTTYNTLLSYVRSTPTPSLRAGRMAAQWKVVQNLLHPSSTTRSTSEQRLASTSDATQPLPVYSPIWVEAVGDEPVAQSVPGSETPAFTPLILAPAEPLLVSELLRDLPLRFPGYHLALIGPRAREWAARDQDLVHHPNQHILPIDLGNERRSIEQLLPLTKLGVRHVLVIGRPTSDDPFTCLEKLATDNGLCELTFLAARTFADQLKTGEVQMGALLLGSFRDGLVHPESGPIAGLLKAIRREHPQSRALTITTSSDALISALDQWLMEQPQKDVEAEVAFDGPRRLVRRLRPVVWNTESIGTQSLTADSVVLATAGARGVTSVMSAALLQDAPLTLVATGRSIPEPGPADGDLEKAERDFYEHAVHQMATGGASALKRAFEKRRGQWEAHEKLERLRSTGGNIHYKIADVTNRMQIDRLVQDVVRQFGRIDLLMHGAGIQISKKLESRSLDDFRQTFSTKVQGLYHLLSSCHHHLGKLPAVHVLTSAYSIFGNDGQHDYGAANEALDRFCDWFYGEPPTASHDSSSRWTSIAWLAWDGVGMTHGTEYRALAHQRGLSGVTAESGQAVFRQVIRGNSTSRIHVPMRDAEHLRYQIRTIPSSSHAEPGRIVERPFELSSWDVLKHHLVRGEPTFPGAWSIDLMVQTALGLTSDPSSVQEVTLQDVQFRRFVQPCRSGQGRVRLVAEESSEWISVWLLGDLYHVTGEPLARDKVLAQAQLHFSQRGSMFLGSLAGFPDEPSAGQKNKSSVVVDPYCQTKAQDVALSGPFDCLRDIQIHSLGRCARFAGPVNDRWPTRIPALLLDGAFRVGAMHASTSGELYVPVRIGRLTLPLRAGGEVHPRDWTIRSTTPRIEDRRVHWARTEAIDTSGVVRIVLENAQASRL